MRKDTQILPGIVRVYLVDSRHLLPNIAERAVAGITIPVMADLTDLDIIGQATCTCQTTRNGNKRTDTAKLKYKSATALPEGIIPAFVVVDANKRAYLIGSKEHPYPIVEQTQSTGTPGGDSAVYEVEVTHKTIRAFPKCDIFVF